MLATLASAPAVAQFQQYVPPGQFEEERETMQDRLDRAMQGARWRVGRTFVDPWLGLRNISHIDDVELAREETARADLTATLGAGLRIYRPVGSELIFTAHALPQYVWWRDLAERRRVTGRYGAGLFGNFGRTGVEISATRDEDTRFFSRELETPVNTRYDIGKANLEVTLGGGVSVFGGAEVRLIRYLEEDDPQLATLDRLDRDEEILRGGIRFSTGETFSVGLGVEESTAEFERVGTGSETAGNRSNSGTSPILQLEFVGKIFDLTANLASRDLEPEPGSDFIAYDEITGSVRLQAKTPGRLRPQLYANKNLVYTIGQRWAYFEDSTIGLGVRTSLGRLASVRIFAEQGTSSYTALATGRIDREDDLDALGADFRLRFGRYTLNLGATRSQYDSSVGQFDREVTVIRSGLNISGGAGSPWG